MRALGQLLGNLLRLAIWPLLWPFRARARARQRWVRLRLRRRLSQLPRPVPAWRRFFPQRLQPRETAMSELHRLATLLAADARIEGLWLTVPRLAAGWAVSEDLRGLLSRLRAAGKRVVVHLPEGAGHREWLIASVADELILGPSAQLHLLGVSSETAYLGGLLERAGLRADVAAVGDFKTAGERFERSEMSEAQREQLGEILACFQGRLEASLASRPLREVDMEGVFARGLWSARDALSAGLVDTLAYEDEIYARLGIESEPEVVSGGRYLDSRQARIWQPLRRQPYVAVVPIHGGIGMGTGSLRTPGTALDPTLARLRAAAADSAAVGVLLDIDSPGGSALVSDLIHHEVERLAARKPVVARFGEVAASGGYYIGVAARRIVAQPLTITGSIGVLSGKLVARALLERFDVRLQGLQLAPHADMHGAGRAWTDVERGLLQRELQAIYDGFLDVVARGRGRSRDEVEGWAGGRVWTGERALSLGLVDRHGDFAAAVEELVSLLPPAQQALGPRLRPRLVEAPGEAPPPRLPEEAPATDAGGLSHGLLGVLDLLASAQVAEGDALCWAPDLPRLR